MTASGFREELHVAFQTADRALDFIGLDAVDFTSADHQAQSAEALPTLAPRQVVRHVDLEVRPLFHLVVSILRILQSDNLALGDKGFVANDEGRRSQPLFLAFGIKTGVNELHHSITRKMNDLWKQSENRANPSGFIHKGATGVTDSHRLGAPKREPAASQQRHHPRRFSLSGRRVRASKRRPGNQSSKSDWAATCGVQFC